MKTLLGCLCCLLMLKICIAQKQTIVATNNSQPQVDPNYGQILLGLTDILTGFGNSNVSNLAQAFQIANAVNKIIDVQQIFKTFSNFSNSLNVGNAVEMSTPPDRNGTQSNSQSSQASPQCVEDMGKILPAINDRKEWALRMLDSLGKPPAGLMGFKATWLGDYDECIAIEPENFQVQYCLTTFWIVNLINPTTKEKGLPARIGLCLPKSCSKQDELIIMNKVVPQITNNQVYVTDLVCQEPDRPFDTKAIISLSVIGVFIFVMILATAYDVFICHFCNENQTKQKYLQKNGIITQKYEKTNWREQRETEFQPGEKPPVLPNVTDFSHSVENGLDAEKPKSNKWINSTSDTYKKPQPGVPGRLLLSFSVYTNAPKILSTRQGAGTLTAINGIRFISMTWVILGHTFVFGLSSVSNVAAVYTKFISRESFMAIMNAEVSVDTFFALSGCLLTYLVLKQLKKGNGKLNWGMFYFHRFWRLTPPYMLFLMVYIPLFGYLGSGPLWEKNGLEKDYCKTTWWYNLLYINNFKTISEQCFGHSWYLANDMQMYIISPLIILPLFFSKIAGPIVLAVFFVVSTVAAGVVTKHFELGISAFGRNGGKYFDEYYQRPYTRIGPYLIGMLTGYILYRTQCQCKINRYLNVLLWLVFATVACVVLYGVYDNFNGDPMSIDLAAFYNAMHKTAWGAAICWVIFACATGNGGFINTLLSWKPFVPLGRLTYCAYLIHPSIQYYYYRTIRQMLIWDDHTIIYEYLAHLVLAYGAAFIASLAFESPMMGLEKVVFGKDKKK